MFGTSPGKDDEFAINDGPTTNDSRGPAPAAATSDSAMGGAPAGNGLDRKASDASNPNTEKKRRSSGVSRARDMFSSAKQSLHLSPNPNAAPAAGSSPGKGETPIQRLGKSDAALSVPQGSLNNSAGESAPTPRSTFRVGVTEDKNKKCRRTMEDTHAYLYNFLSTPAPSFGGEKRGSTSDAGSSKSDNTNQQVAETDNGYFAIFDGHAGTFAADWCGKKLHLILEETIKKNPNTPIPELLDQTFTAVDNQLEKLPLKNSGCTAVTAVLRWEDRIPNAQSSTGSVLFAPAAASAIKSEAGEANQTESAEAQAVAERLQGEASRQRVLYTANVGDARIVLCRNGRALRLSYDHKGSDENEGRRVASAGGLILNNRVNGVLAVTRALGDAYMKDLVTGHPYTTETVIQADQDEFLILACDGVSELFPRRSNITNRFSSGMSARIRRLLTSFAKSRILRKHPKSLLITPWHVSRPTTCPAWSFASTTRLSGSERTKVLSVWKATLSLRKATSPRPRLLSLRQGSRLASHHSLLRARQRRSSKKKKRRSRVLS